MSDDTVTDTTVITAVCDSCPDFDRSGRGEAEIGEVLAECEAHAALGHSVSAEIGEPGGES